MSDAAKKISLESQIALGKFTREEAAELIVHGKTHLHSTSGSEADDCYDRTLEALGSGMSEAYDWELHKTAKSILITSSAQRTAVILETLSALGITGRTASEKVQSILEELLSNAIFHAYRDEEGGRKYHREEIAALKAIEGVTLSYAAGEKGFFLSVKDQGGTLTFDKFKNSLQRCYQKNQNNQIESKVSGAGLGLYMTFEFMTHLKIEVVAGVSTTVSCWVSKPYEKGRFSFNFFTREK